MRELWAFFFVCILIYFAKLAIDDFNSRLQSLELRLRKLETKETHLRTEFYEESES